MRQYKPVYSQFFSKGRFTLRERNGQWWLTYPNGDEGPAGTDEAAARELMNDLHHDFANSNCRVYFVGEVAELGRMVKIGYTRNPRRRLADLQVGCPCILRLLAITPGTVDVELDYHARFAEQRRHGEWFVIDAEILAEIERLRAARRQSRAAA